MFKLFDFKFLILLGLTLVVYFMYKEIDYQKERIQQCENQLKTLLETNPNQFHNEETPKLDNKQCKPPRPPLQYPKKNEELFEKQVPNKKKPEIKQSNKSQPKSEVKSEVKPDNNLNLKLPIKMIEELVKSANNTESDKVDKDSDKIDKDSEKESENENKHLEIYSNDNENLIETTISDSLINKNLKKVVSISETSESQSDSNIENINKISYSEENNNNYKIDLENKDSKTEESKKEDSENKDSKTEESENEDSENKDSKTEESENKELKVEETEESENKELKVEESEELENKELKVEELKNKDSEILINKEEAKLENIVSKKISKNSQKSKSSKEELDELLKDLKIEMDDIKSPKVDLQSLLKMKVPELQNLALKENINLEKNVNGHSKKKTKQELAEEIFGKKNI